MLDIPFSTSTDIDYKISSISQELQGVLELAGISPVSNQYGQLAESILSIVDSRNQVLINSQISLQAQITLLVNNISVIDWMSNTTDSVLQVGQTAVYRTFTPVNSLPLNIMCDSGQLYEFKIIQTAPSAASGLSIYLYPNNNIYAGAFSVDNIGSNYNVTPPAMAVGVTLAQNSFLIPDIAGSAIVPFIMTGSIFTGDNYTPKMLNYTNSGGIATQGGALLGSTVWNDITTPYTSLGTILKVASVTNNFYVTIKRIF